jgi:hypothetical protein
MQKEWNKDMSYKKLHAVYSFHLHQVNKLEKLLIQKQMAKQNTCQHVWEKDMSARGGRSRYDCTKCGKYR